MKIEEDRQCQDPSRRLRNAGACHVAWCDAPPCGAAVCGTADCALQRVPRRRLTTGQHLEHTHEARAASRICTSFRVRQSLLGRSNLADALHVAWHHLSVATGDTAHSHCAHNDQPRSVCTRLQVAGLMPGRY